MLLSEGVAQTTKQMRFSVKVQLAPSAELLYNIVITLGSSQVRACELVSPFLHMQLIPQVSSANRNVTLEAFPC